LAFLVTALAVAADAASNQQQEFLGQADACRTCLRFMDGGERFWRALISRICGRLLAIWPPDYYEYRQRYMAFQEQDPTLPDKVNCLQLREWYDVVDELHTEIDCAASQAQPPSKARVRLETLLLRVPGERTPIAD
jgi:hypothetical protein